MEFVSHYKTTSAGGLTHALGKLGGRKGKEESNSIASSAALLKALVVVVLLLADEGAVVSGRKGGGKIRFHASYLYGRIYCTNEGTKNAANTFLFPQWPWRSTPI